MEAWEIERIEKMSEEEQREYYEKVIKKYQEEIKKLKRTKAYSNKSALSSCAWRAGIIGAMLVMFGGGAMIGFGEGAVRTAGEISMLSSLALFGGGMYGMLMSDDNGPIDIKLAFEAAKDAKKQIKEIKEKIKEIEQKPVMANR